MRKAFLVVVLSCLLVACQNIEDPKSSLFAKTKAFQSSALYKKANHHKGLYSYYLPRMVNVLDTQYTYDILSYKGITFAMSLNVSQIINKAYYPSFAHLDTQIYDDAYMIYSYGFIHDGHSYEVRLYQIEDSYLLNLNTDYVSFHAMMRSNYLGDVLAIMLKMANNVVVDEKEVVKTMSNRPIIDYEKEQLDLFQIVVPQDGRLEDLIAEN